MGILSKAGTGLEIINTYWFKPINTAIIRVEYYIPRIVFLFYRVLTMVLQNLLHAYTDF